MNCTYAFIAFISSLMFSQIAPGSESCMNFLEKETAYYVNLPYTNRMAYSTITGPLQNACRQPFANAFNRLVRDARQCSTNMMIVIVQVNIDNALLSGALLSGGKESPFWELESLSEGNTKHALLWTTQRKVATSTIMPLARNLKEANGIVDISRAHCDDATTVCLTLVEATSVYRCAIYGPEIDNADSSEPHSIMLSNLVRRLNKIVAEAGDVELAQEIKEKGQGHMR